MTMPTKSPMFRIDVNLEDVPDDVMGIYAIPIGDPSAPDYMPPRVRRVQPTKEESIKRVQQVMIEGRYPKMPLEEYMANQVAAVHELAPVLRALSEVVDDRLMAVFFDQWATAIEGDPLPYWSVKNNMAESVSLVDWTQEGKWTSVQVNWHLWARHFANDNTNAFTASLAASRYVDVSLVRNDSFSAVVHARVRDMRARVKADQPEQPAEQPAQPATAKTKKH